jgi:hypothetical protein
MRRGIRQSRTVSARLEGQYCLHEITMHQRIGKVIVGKSLAQPPELITSLPFCPLGIQWTVTGFISQQVINLLTEHPIVDLGNLPPTKCRCVKRCRL